MNHLMLQTICAVAAFAWDPKEIDERHEKAQEAKADRCMKPS